MRKWSLRFAVLLLSAASPFAACGGGDKKVAGPKAALGEGGNEDLNIPKVDPKLCDTKDKRVELFDLNQDGKPDVWKLYVEGKGGAAQMTCKQVDLNHDGKKDYVAEYDEAGNLIVEEYDFDFDGNFDARVYFDRKTGKKYAAERVSGFSAKPDVWERYDASERLEARRRDRNGDGKPDYWEQYLGGELDKILYDDNFDGKVDRKEEAHPERDLGAAAGAAAAAEGTTSPLAEPSEAEPAQPEASAPTGEKKPPAKKPPAKKSTTR